MSEFHAHLDERDFDRQFQEPQSTNGFAIASLVCSLIICCPIVTILGPIFGAVALVSIGSPPRQKGKGLAIAGIIIGILTTVIGVMGSYWIVVRSMYMIQGADEVMTAGFAGDIAGFKNSFRQGARVPDDEARAFLDELEQRYGNYIGLYPDETGTMDEGDTPGTMLMPYRIDFVNQALEAEAEVHFLTMELEYIIIRDPDLGDLRFPPLQ